MKGTSDSDEDQDGDRGQAPSGIYGPRPTHPHTGTIEVTPKPRDDERRPIGPEPEQRDVILKIIGTWRQVLNRRVVESQRPLGKEISTGTVLLAVARLRRRGELPRAKDRARAALHEHAGAGLSDAEIAELAGVSRVTVTRARNEMRSRGDLP